MDSEKGRALPKFGEWDVNDPSSAEGFTVIFNKARDEKKTSSSSSFGSTVASSKQPKQNENSRYPSKRRWFCMG